MTYAIVILIAGAHGGSWATRRTDIASRDEAIETAKTLFRGLRRQVVEMPSREVVAEWAYRKQNGKTVLTRTK